MAELKDLAEWWEDFLAYFMSNPQANMADIDVNQAVLDAGYNPADLAGLDQAKIYESACGRPGVLPEYRTPLTTPHPTPDQIVRHVTQISEVHNHNTQIINDSSTNIDNSVDFDVDGDFSVDGDFDFDNKPVTATDGGVAAGHDAVGATGAGSAASGTGDAAASGGVNLDASTNLDLQFGRGDGPSLLTAQGPLGVPARVLNPDTGGLLPGRPDINVNTGAGGQNVVDGPNAGVIGNFGDGANVANLPGANLTNSAVGRDDVDNVGGNTVGDGSGLGIAGGDITGDYDDESQHAQTSGDDSPIFQEQGAGDQHLEEEQEEQEEKLLEA